MNNAEIIEIVNATPKAKKIFYLKVIRKIEYDGYLNTKEFVKNSWNSGEEYNFNSNAKLENIIRSLKSPISTNFDTLTTSQEKTFKSIITLVIRNAIHNQELSITHDKDRTQREVNEIVKAFLIEYIRFLWPDIELKYNDYYITRQNFNLKIINSLDEYIESISKFNPRPDDDIFFRGQSNINYLLIPSVLRNEKWYNNESYLCKSMTRLCPKSFNGLMSHIDKLVEMQHYELPTRLLDISKNALVALLFACIGNSNLDGEVIIFAEKKENIKYGQSDTVSILSCLSQFSSEDQLDIINSINSYNGNIDDFNKKESIRKLLHEIKAEKPAFRDIIDPQDIQKNIFAMPALINDRIVKQSGAFIITGLVEYSKAKDISDNLNTKRYKESGITPILVIDQASKNVLKRQLNLCDINEASVFPEIDRVAQYLKSSLLK